MVQQLVPKDLTDEEEANFSEDTLDFTDKLNLDLVDSACEDHARSDIQRFKYHMD
jgi:hypothetical protein